MRGQAALKIVEPLTAAPVRQLEAAVAAPQAFELEIRPERPAWLFRGLFAVNLSMWVSILFAIRALV